MNKPAKIYQNTMLITLLSVLERTLGFLYRVVLARLLGAEGLGVYQIAVSHFFLLRTLGGGGLPVTLSRAVATENAKGKSGEHPLAAALFLSFAVTLPLTLFILVFSGVIPFLQDESGVLKILTVSLPFACGYAVVKGYFWGKKQFAPPAVIELFEEIVMTVLGTVLLLIFKNTAPAQAARYAALSMSISCVFSATVSAFTLAKRKIKPRLQTGTLLPVFRGALPITSMRLCATLIASVSAVLLPYGLEKAGYSASEALAAFGVVTGMVLPLLTAPMTVVGALSTVLVPELAEANALNQTERLRGAMQKGLFFTFAVTVALVPFFYALGTPLCNLLYENPLAGKLLKYASFLLPPLSVAALAQSFINSLGHEKNSFIISTIGSAAFLVCILFLPRFLGIYAYLIALALEFILSAVCSLVFLFRRCPPEKSFFRRLAVPFLLSVCILPFACVCLRCFARLFPEPFATLTASLLLLSITALLFVLFGVFPKKTRKKVPSSP